MIALKFLKANNPLYSHIDINEEWLEQAFANDDELCKYLIEQNDENMHTEYKVSKNDHCSDNASSSHCDLPTLPVNEDCEHVECFSYTADGKSAFTVALHELEAMAHLKGFEVYDVPYDGNCMFSAISHQLKISDVCNVDSDELRKMVANYLEANSAVYCCFVSQPVASQDAYNADTEPPTAEDECINNVADPQLQVVLGGKSTRDV